MNICFYISYSFLIGIVYAQYSCLQEPPNNTYCDAQNDCVLCTNTKCKTCSSDLNSCLTCDKFLYNSDCYPTEPAGTYCDPTSKTCQSCTVTNCAKCSTGVGTCDACNQATSDIFLYNNECKNTQPPNTVCNSQNVCSLDTCQLITSNCLTCDKVNNICTSCTSGLYLLQNNSPPGQTCVTQAQVPASYNCDSQNVCKEKTCPQVTSNCLQCDLTLNKCTLCSSGFYLFDNNSPGSLPSCVTKDKIPNNYNCDSQNICQNNQCSSITSTPNCFLCDIPSNNCTQCSSGLYLLQIKNQKPTCVTKDQIPNNFNCDSSNICQLNQCLLITSNCQTCDLVSNKCTQCSPEFYLLNNNSSSQSPSCVTKDQIPKNYNCYSNMTCNECSPNDNSCSGSIKDCYLYEGKCNDEQPKNTYCQKQNSTYDCFKCNDSCLECSGPSEKECKSCYPSAMLTNQECKQAALNYPSSFSVAKVQALQDQTLTTSMTSNVSSTILSTSQNLVAQSSFSLLVSGLTSQKLTYLLLVNINLPPPAFQSLQATQSQLPSHQMSRLNFLNHIFPAPVLKYFNIKFESIDLEYNILNTCGQGVSIFLTCSFIFGLFYFMIDKLPVNALQSASKTLYLKLVCGFAVQYIQLTISIFAIGINSQILEFVHEASMDLLPVKIILTILLPLIIILTFYYLYHFLNFNEVLTNNLTFAEITREKILNETIFESKYRRNYIIILLFFESIIIPTIFIQLNAYKIVSSILAILFQTGFFVATCILMPFHSKLTNRYFVLTTFLWLCIYINYLILVIYSSKDDISLYADTLDNLSWCFFVLIQLILLSNPVYMILNLMMKAIDFIKQKIAEKKLKAQEELQLEQFSSIHQQIELFQSYVVDIKQNPNNYITESASREIITPITSKSNRHSWIQKRF